MENRCVICDSSVPEGRQVCCACERAILERQPSMYNNDDISLFDKMRKILQRKQKDGAV